MYFVYILECNDKTLYTGVTKDLSKRINEHNESTKAAKYTRARRPVNLVYFSSFNTRSEAMKEEFRIKQIKRSEKINLINNNER